MVTNKRGSALSPSVFSTCLRWSSNVDADMVCGVFASVALVIVAGVLMLTPSAPSSLFEDPQYVNFSTAPTVPVWQMSGFPNPFKHADSARPTYTW